MLCFRKPDVLWLPLSENVNNQLWFKKRHIQKTTWDKRNFVFGASLLGTLDVSFFHPRLVNANESRLSFPKRSSHEVRELCVVQGKNTKVFLKIRRAFKTENSNDSVSKRKRSKSQLIGFDCFHFGPFVALMTFRRSRNELVFDSRRLAAFEAGECFVSSERIGPFRPVQRPVSSGDPQSSHHILLTYHPNPVHNPLVNLHRTSSK